jgi:hypothetical protein
MKISLFFGAKKHIRFSLVTMAALLLGFLIFDLHAQPSPIELLPFSKMNDSSRNPVNIIDPAFMPNPEIRKHTSIWQMKSGEAFTVLSKEHEFYLMAGLFLFLGLTIRFFPKYFIDMSRLFFQSGFRQKSIRDQLLQNTAASLAVNAIFFFAAGLYIYQIGIRQGFELSGTRLSQILACIAFLLVIYLIKRIALSLGGWIFGSYEMANQYAFIIFFVNKIIGLVLLPIIMVLFLGRQSLHPFFTVISFIVLLLLFLYRYFLILPTVRRQSGVSSFHFFIYLCTFEILPILITVKYLVNLLSKSN